MSQESDRGKHIDTLKLDIARGRSNLGKVVNSTVTWSALRALLAKPAIGNESQAEYLRMAKAEQDKLKNVGFFIGGHCAEGKRQADKIKERSLVTFDIDAGTPGMMDDLELGLTELANYEWCVYSTRKHTKQNPRIRVVIPLVKPVSADKYSALARILAAKIDHTMDAIDDVSFRLAQMMFQPSHSRGADWVTMHNKGKLVDGDAVLAQFGDWRDVTKLPYSEKQGQKRLSDPALKAENPTEKPGVIGAFCRLFDIEEAIRVHLPDVYTPGDEHASKPRYTFVGASTTNGAVVEDDGLFLYSHHSTDPCGDMLVNSWDLVRIHKFAALDKEVEDKSKPGKLPSFKAMFDFAMAIPAVAKECAKSNYDLDAIFDDLEDEKPKADPDDIDNLLSAPLESYDKSWMDSLQLTEAGLIKQTYPNLAIIVENDPRLKGAIQRNVFTGEIVTRKRLLIDAADTKRFPLRDPVNGDMWTDSCDRTVRSVLEGRRGKGGKGYELKTTVRDIHDAVEHAADKYSFHPVKEYLEKLEWDGFERLDRIFIDYLGVPDNAYTREAARLTMLAVVARTYEPGHKYDYMLIVEGLQGKRKSTFFATLAKHWFAEMHCNFKQRKESVEVTSGSTIIELPELSTFRTSEVETIKAFISSVEDKVRLAYERRARPFPRQCIFVGSTNNDRYLKDDTGNRRFLPIKAGDKEINLERLEKEIDQIYAETLELYRTMRAAKPYGWLPLFLGKDAELIAAGERDARMEHNAEEGMSGLVEKWLNQPISFAVAEGADPVMDAFDDDIEELIGGPVPTRQARTEVCLIEIWIECFRREPADYAKDRSLAHSLGRIMRDMAGWKNSGVRITKKYGPQKVYKRITNTI